MQFRKTLWLQCGNWIEDDRRGNKLFIWLRVVIVGKERKEEIQEYLGINQETGNLLDVRGKGEDSRMTSKPWAPKKLVKQGFSVSSWIYNMRAKM